MFRLYELYSLYSQNKMYRSSTLWCLCEKLPRSILHVAPTPKVWCEVCGRRRRPQACSTSSSDEEKPEAEHRQPVQRVVKETDAYVMPQKLNKAVKKPKTVYLNSNCLKCGRQSKPSSIVQQEPKVKDSTSNKVYMGRHGHYRKPKRLHAKRHAEMINNYVEPMAPPPPPSPPPSNSPPVNGSESVWEPPDNNMPKPVAFAQNGFTRPPRDTQPKTLLVSDFIPLDKPITDVASGAISKRPSLHRPLCSHYSRALPPLSRVVSQILVDHKVRAKGGGLPAKQNVSKDSSCASQFSPFNSYEGPSEDALVGPGVRQMLLQPRALHIQSRNHLPSTKLSTFDSDPSSECSTSSGHFDMPTAPPTERQCHSYTVGPSLQMREMMNTVAQSGLSDNSASSSSQKSTNSTLPGRQESVRSCDDEEPELTKKSNDADMGPTAIMEKLLWLIDQHPTDDATPDPNALLAQTDASLMDAQVKSDGIIDKHSESVKVLLQFVKNLHIEGTNNNSIPSTILNNNIEDNLKTSADSPLPELHISNDMSNEFYLNTSNKSAGDAKYVNVLSNANNAKYLEKRETSHLPGNGDTSIWSFITRFFKAKHYTETTTALDDSAVISIVTDELKPLKSAENLHYGAINQFPKKHNFQGKKSINQIVSSNSNNWNCRKCGLHRASQVEYKKNCGFCSSDSNTRQTARLSMSNCLKMHDKQTIKSAPKTCHEKHVNTKMQAMNLTKPFENKYSSVHEESKKSFSLKERIQNVKQNSEESVTTSTIFETCNTSVGSVLDGLKSAPLPRDIELLALLQRRLIHKVPKPLTVYQVASTIETIRFECSEIIKPKMTSFTVEMGRVEYSTLENLRLNKHCGLIEFRIPDIRKVVARQEKANEYNIELSTTSESSKYFEDSLSESNTTPSKRHLLAVWPGHAFSYRKRSKKSKTMQELKSAINDDRSADEDDNAQTKREVQDTWISNQLVQRKIHEMMIKPIRLLN
ncbi:hypothetical protein KR215_001526 [Drosophila sulfurigaster]|nr:hypothetical protein KR215_001526 [Drosophila sulfurigaster]